MSNSIRQYVHFFRWRPCLFVVAMVGAPIYAQDTAVSPLPAIPASVLPDTGTRTAPAIDSASGMGDSTIVPTSAATDIPTVPVAAGVTDSALKSPQSGYYSNQPPAYTGMGRGMPAQQPAAPTQRTRIVDTVPGPHNDTSAEKAAVTAPDSLLPPKKTPENDNSASQPTTVVTTSRTARVVAAIGTTAAIGGIVAIVLAKKFTDTDNTAEQTIPDPPPPPGY